MTEDTVSRPDLTPRPWMTTREDEIGMRIVKRHNAVCLCGLDLLDRFRAIEKAARWLTDIWAGSTSIEAGSALAEDIERLRAALGAPHDPE